MGTWIGNLRRRLAAVRRKDALERDMDAEMRQHIELEAQDLVRAYGLSLEEARRRAYVAFGGLERFKEEARDTRGARWLEDFGADLRYGVRGLRRSPAFATAAALTLALGIGVTTALFSVVESVLLQPLPFGNPARTVVIWSSWKDFPKTWVSFDEFEVFQDEPHLFSAIALFTDYPATLTGTGEPERLRAAQASRDIFRVLGVTPMLGRGFLAEEDTPGGPNVAVIGHELWARRFAADPAVLDRAIKIEGQIFRIVGVLPRGFRMPLDYSGNGVTELLTPLAAQADSVGATAGPALQPYGGSHGFYAAATLAPGVTVEQANRTLRAIADRNTKQGIYPESWHFRSTAIPIREEISGSMRPVLLILLGAVVAVLLIACANVAGLLLVRGDRRRRETTLRAVLGAGRDRLARQFVTEGLALAVAGGVLGIAVAWIGVAATRFWAPATLPLVRDLSLNARVLAFALATTLATVALFALAPALAATRVDLTDASKDGGRGATTGRSRLRARELLVTVEIALAVALIVAGGLMIRTVQRLLAIDPGFRSEGVLTMALSLPADRYPDDARTAAFFTDLRRRVAAVPGVQAVGAVRLLPLASQLGDWGLSVEGYTPPPNEGTPGDWQVVTPGYFEAMRMRLLAGRFFDERDDAQGAPAIVVSRRFVERYFAGRDPLGAHIRVSGPTRTQSTVVGVVEDVGHNALVSERKPTFYVSHAQFHLSTGSTPRTMQLAVRAQGDASALTAAVRAQARAVDPQIPITGVRLMDEIVRGSVAPQRFGMQLLAAFGTLALLLAMVGIYGIVAQVVAARMREFGVRSALGATPGSLVRMSLANGARHAAVGLIVGTLAALALTQLLSGMLYGVAPRDPATFAAAIIATGLAALAACWIPARRAARADPAATLRNE